MKIGYLMQEQAADIRQHRFSGPSIHVRHVFRELENLGHHVRLVAKLDGQIWTSDNLEDFQPVSVRWLDQRSFHFFERSTRYIQSHLHLPYLTVFDSLHFAAACCQVLSDCDLLYERMSWMGYGGSLAASWLRIPLFLENNGDHIAEMELLGVAPQGLQRWLSIKLMQFGINKASHIVAAGDGWRRRFIERWGVPEERITTVENGCELVHLLKRDQLRAFSPTQEAPAELTLAYLGGFQPWQGVTILLRAFRQVIQTGVKAKLVLIGSGTDLDELKQLVNELEIDHFVRFTGQLPVKQYAPLLASADIGVAPYCGWPEFSGLKLLDYKAAGLAIIASGLHGQPATLRHGKTASIVPPCDESALADAIVQLCRDHESRRRLGQQARIEAERNHDWRHTAENLDKLFFETIKGMTPIDSQLKEKVVGYDDKI
jgi:glycosyltransferase involved in cell wall biosynthesis